MVKKNDPVPRLGWQKARWQKRPELSINFYRKKNEKNMCHTQTTVHSVDVYEQLAKMGFSDTAFTYPTAV